jgi:adenylosuccinate lyase
MIPRYTRPEMAAIWDPQTRFRIWFEIEAHATDALAELVKKGLIDQDEALSKAVDKDALRNLLKIGQPDTPAPGV